MRGRCPRPLDERGLNSKQPPNLPRSHRPVKASTGRGAARIRTGGRGFADIGNSLRRFAQPRVSPAPKRGFPPCATTAIPRFASVFRLLAPWLAPSGPTGLIPVSVLQRDRGPVRVRSETLTCPLRTSASRAQPEQGTGRPAPFLTSLRIRPFDLTRGLEERADFRGHRLLHAACPHGFRRGKAPESTMEAAGWLRRSVLAFPLMTRPNATKRAECCSMRRSSWGRHIGVYRPLLSFATAMRRSRAAAGAAGWDRAIMQIRRAARCR